MIFGVSMLVSLIPELSTQPSSLFIHVIVGWAGTLIPAIVLFYAPLALFLGLLIQLIWEEKNITQPL
jgi:hypothetical protein